MNTLNVAFERESKVNYKRNHVEYVATPDQESELKTKLQAAGLAVDVKPYTRKNKQRHAPTNGAHEALHSQPQNYEMEGEYRFFHPLVIFVICLYCNI